MLWIQTNRNCMQVMVSKFSYIICWLLHIIILIIIINNIGHRQRQKIYYVINFFLMTKQKLDLFHLLVVDWVAANYFMFNIYTLGDMPIISIAE